MLDNITETAKYDSPAEMEVSRECPTCGGATKQLWPDVWECLACGDQWDLSGEIYCHFSHQFSHPSVKIKGPTELSRA
jgi:hypothetical protein